jgi:hypothetical protein
LLSFDKQDMDDIYHGLYDIVGVETTEEDLAEVW